jgi:DNA-binding protein H-NS
MAPKPRQTTQGTPPGESSRQPTDPGTDETQPPTDVTQLQELVRTMAQERQADREQIAQLRTQVTALAAANQVIPSIERDAQETENTTSDAGRPGKAIYSKKRPDPPVFTDGTDPTFESWKIQIRAKLRANADHYPSEEDKMEYLFSRTLGDAQKHLLPRFDEDSPTRFTSVKEMLSHLASIYVNPNKVRDAQFEYHRLRMETGQTFSAFQTTFLHLAGEGQIPKESLRLDLFDKLPAYYQRMLLPVLDDLKEYEQLAARCLTLDTGLKRIEEMNKKKGTRASDKSTAPAPPAAAGTARTPSATPAPKASPSPPERHSRHSTPAAETAATCFNCHKLGHFAASCPEPRRTDFKVIEGEEEELSDVESVKEEP